jgi:predicted ribosomally synthesized peptide with SipW-like signal peptide
MSDDNITLSRRNVLAGLGAVGAAGLGAGLGTNALFTDQETFSGNTVAAGNLDLKIDWEEHYSHPQLYGFGDPTANLDHAVTRSQPDDPAKYQPLPDPNNPAVWVHEDDLNAYMAATAIEAYPDTDDDGSQDEFNTNTVGSVCTDGADTADDMDPSGLRTDNADTSGGAPLVDLTDVKPGDFGELTLSYHLCNNPGYVWLAGELVTAEENDVVDPEADAPGETDGTVELLDEITATVWYDADCDNVFEEATQDGGAVDLILAVDRSTSMDGTRLANAKSGAKNLIDALGPNDQVGLVSFGADVSLDEGLTSNHLDVKQTVEQLSAGGSTVMGQAVEQAHEELLDGDQGTGYAESGNARPGARKILIVLGDGGGNGETPAGNAKVDGIEIFTIAYGNDANASELDAMASLPSSSSLSDNPEDQYFYTADVSEIEALFQSLGDDLGSAGEALITRGSLGDVLSELSTGNGIPLDSDRGTGDVTAFPPRQTNCVGLSWHLPRDTGNSVQSDIVQFDVGFYAEQSRNNDGPN